MLLEPSFQDAVPGMNVSDSALQYSSAFDGFRRVDDDLVVLVDRVGAVTPEHPVQPAVGVAGGVAEREAGRRVVRLQRLAHREEAREVLREFLEAGLVQRRLAVGHVAADGRDGNAEPVVALLAGHGGRIGPAAVLLAEIVGDVVHLEHFGREQLRQRMQAPGEIEALPGVGRHGCLRLNVLEGLAEHVHLGAGGGLECRDHRVERFIFGRHEALPAHHRELGALLRLPGRGLRPGFCEVEQRRPGQRAGRRQRGAALKQSATCKVLHGPSSRLSIFWLLLSRF